MDLTATLGWSHVTVIIDSTWSQGTTQKLHDVAGLRHICIVDVIVVHDNVSSIQDTLRRTVEEHARKGRLFVVNIFSDSDEKSVNIFVFFFYRTCNRLICPF